MGEGVSRASQRAAVTPSCCGASTYLLHLSPLRASIVPSLHSAVPTKVGMKLTGHKTVAMFMHYVRTEDKPVRDAAAELVASRRQAITGARQLAEGAA